MKAKKLSTKVYMELRRKILSNQLEGGTRLKEDFWAKKMDVNRMAVREALMRLRGGNLVVPGEKGGYFVKSMTAVDVKEIRELREILELGALRLGFQKMQNKMIDELESISDDFTSMVKGRYFGGACEADVRFHETLIDCAGNKKLKEIYQMSNIPLFHKKLGNTYSYLEDYEQTDQEHRKILEALKDKNLELAEEILVKHLVRGEMIVLDFERSISNSKLNN